MPSRQPLRDGCAVTNLPPRIYRCTSWLADAGFKAQREVVMVIHIRATMIFAIPIVSLYRCM